MAVTDVQVETMMKAGSMREPVIPVQPPERKDSSDPIGPHVTKEMQHDQDL